MLSLPEVWFDSNWHNVSSIYFRLMISSTTWPEAYLFGKSSLRLETISHILISIYYRVFLNRKKEGNRIVPENFKRKLTAILSADVEGYSLLMGDYEESIIRTLKNYRQVWNFYSKLCCSLQ